MSKEEEFVDTIRQNEGIIYKITKVYCTNTENQKDLYQDIVYQLWKSFDALGQKCTLYITL